MGNPIRDLTGERFGGLTVLEFVGVNKYHRALWRCVCDCGAIQVVRGHSLTTTPSNKCKSCGHIKHSHAQSTAYGGLSPTYISWQHMKDRCYNRSHKYYNNYGGKGVTVCTAWRDNFTQFLADMGERPDGTTLDRINSNDNYYKENCRWSTLEVQNENRVYNQKKEA